jgi:hypothetical protein
MQQMMSPTMPGPLGMASKKQTPDDKDLPTQVNFKPSPELMRRLVAVSRGLEVDLANLVRMILRENLYLYERRAKEAQQGPGSDN